MLKNYLKVAFRSFARKKFYASLNTLGLAIGFAAFVIILIDVHYERNFEGFHNQADRIYRATYLYKKNDNFQVHWARIPFDFVNEMPKEIPEIKHFIRFQNRERKYVRVRDEKFLPCHAYVTDKEVFKVFNFSLVAGNPENALANPNSVVISRKLARQYFGSTDVLGRNLYLTGEFSPEEVNYTVTGVMKDLPSNTHLPVDMLISFNDPSERSGWAYIYTLLQEGADIADVESKMADFVSKYNDENQANHIFISFQPLADIHLQSNLAREIIPNGNEQYVTILFYVGLFILLISTINFINLSAAISVGRSKEVGVRTILGARKPQIIGYSLIESTLHSVGAAWIGLLIAYLALPYFKTLTAIEFLYNPWSFVLTVTLIAVFTGCLSGLYPAFLLTANKSLDAIKQKTSFKLVKKKTDFNVKRLMITLQFCVSILLVGSTITAYNQFRYLHEKNLGIEREQVLAIPNLPNSVVAKFNTFKNYLAPMSGVEGISACMEVPSREIRDSGPVLIQGVANDPETAPVLDIQVIEPGFIEMMGIKLLAGSNLTKDEVVDGTSDVGEGYLGTMNRTYLINETAMKKLGWQNAEEAIGQYVSWSIDNIKLAPGPITGVVQDYHQETLKNKIDPVIMVAEPIWLRTFLVKVNTENMPETIQNIQTAWDELFPAYPLEYHFLDDLYGNLYKNERAQIQLLYVFCSLAIFIAFMGLLSLVAYSLKTRIREIAIRKVLGAGLPDLIHLIGKEYLMVMILGGIIAVPLSYWAVTNWLNNFAYRINISAGTYVFTLLLTGVLLLITISAQTLGSSAINPAETLKEEQ